MNAFTSKINETNKGAQYRQKLGVLQVNMGNLCNQRCRHCHVGAGPEGKNVMSKETIGDVISFLKKSKGELVLDLTGGAPEMNANFKYFVTSASQVVKDLIVRTNLTVLLEPGNEDVPVFLMKNKVHLIGSFPCYTKDNVDKQRGSGVYEKSIRVLKMLNDLGYGRSPDLRIDLVYNPGGAFLPQAQDSLEKDYKKIIKEE